MAWGGGRGELERLISIKLKQWRGIPRCLSSVRLYGHGKLELPIIGLVEEFKCTKVRLVMTLTESEDAVIRTAGGSGKEVDSIRSCSECKVCASLQRCGWTSTAWEGRVRTHPKNSSVAQSNISAEETASHRRSQETGGGRATCQSHLNGHFFHFGHFILLFLLNKNLSEAWRHAHCVCRLLFSPQYTVYIYIYIHILCTHLHLSVYHQLPDRQAAACEAERTYIQHPHHQHWSSSGLCSLPTSILSLHKWLHLYWPPLSNSWSLQMTPQSSVLYRTETSLLTDKRLRSWLSGAITTTWSWTRLKL